jgi:hypothetical protein
MTVSGRKPKTNSNELKSMRAEGSVVAAGGGV